ncbi:dihydroxyacetone kinase subunit DhaK [Lichenibacterium dinghuense]|uniref:dihydroxyacetone kinase subunit DhaK n=1 Tax=Lichenibacterium dinghuense TaxID=2895977 RepID=UPI001F00634C|nr:dihydroxyacetone kinase subunit DhaK [Lichenibacterium sp. 6Y81]
MNRVIDDPEEVAEDFLRGALLARPDLLAATDHPRVVRRSGEAEPRVGVVTGGGSGHEPAFVGYVGPGLVDAAAIGEIFASPTAKSFHAAFRAADRGHGVACLYGNYAGDNMNVKMAVKLAAKDGITVKTAVADDDVASASSENRDKRRGVAGEILMWKVGGARAAEGGTLDEVVAAAQHALDNTRSIGIGLSACTIPAAGKPNFSIPDGSMEVGIGHHGEPGVAVLPMARASEMAELMVDRIVADLPFRAGDAVTVLISGLGATPLMELYLLYGRVDALLRGRGITPVRRLVGNYFTSLEMSGVSLTLMRMDAELERLMETPCTSIGLTLPEGW